MSAARPRLRLHGAAWIVTCQGPDRGPVGTWAELGAHAGWEIVVERDPAEGGWRTLWLGPADAADRPATDAAVDLGGRLLVPGLVDCHTHAVFAGDRAEEFSRRMAGATYAEIAQAGGGIASTVRQTRAASLPTLIDGAAARLEEMAAWGTRVVEIKTGYALDLAGECKLLDAIEALRGRFAGRLCLLATAMPAHAIPPEFAGDADGYVGYVCDTVLPALAGTGVELSFVDVFIESGYFDVAQAGRIWAVARELGLQLKAHVDEFAAIGGLDWAVTAGATSVEHLLQTDTHGVLRLAASPTVAVCLPLTSLYLREPYAPMRALVDHGARVAIATDCNPGSAMTCNLPLAMQIAVLGGHLTPAEALRAVTRGGAQALGEPGGYRGRIAPGEPFVATLFDLARPDDLFYQLGQPPRAAELRLGAVGG